MTSITITAEVVGESYLYEHESRKGRRKKVPSYKMEIQTNSKKNEFAVTRDVSDTVFGKTERHFGTGGECPPSLPDKPYFGRLYSSDTHSFAICLCEKDLDNNSLMGTGKTVRTDILIHNGPTRSEGCFTVVGGKQAYKKFTKLLKPILESGKRVEVIVEPREV